MFNALTVKALYTLNIQENIPRDMTAYCNWCGKATSNDRIRRVTDKKLRARGHYQCIECILSAVSNKDT